VQQNPLLNVWKENLEENAEETTKENVSDSENNPLVKDWEGSEESEDWEDWKDWEIAVWAEL
jgi:hypothetical protein